MLRQGGRGATRRGILAAAAVLCGAACRKEEQPEPRQAIVAAQDMVRVRLASPGSAAFGGEADTVVKQLSPERFRVQSMVDYTARDGTTMRVSFTAVVAYRGSEKWTLEELEFK